MSLRPAKSKSCFSHTFVAMTASSRGSRGTCSGQQPDHEAVFEKCRSVSVIRIRAGAVLRRSLLRLENCRTGDLVNFGRIVDAALCDRPLQSSIPICCKDNSNWQSRQSQVDPVVLWKGMMRSALAINSVRK